MPRSALRDRLLRQPQLASVLPARHQDAGLRAVGRPRLPRAGQCHHAVRRGSNVLGCEIGFSELLRAGEIERHAAHLRSSAGELRPDRRSVSRRRATEPVATEIRPTIAEGTAIAQPIRLAEVLGTLRETRGGAVMLSEEEIAAATLELARHRASMSSRHRRRLSRRFANCWRPARSRRSRPQCWC